MGPDPPRGKSPEGSEGREILSAYHLNVFVHLMAALVWLGGMFFLAVVGAPVLRGVDPPRLRA